MDEMYETFADQVRKLVPFDSIGFGLADPETGVGRLTSRIGDGFHPQASRQGFVVPGSPMEKMLETKDSILIQSSDSQDTIERFPALAQAIESGHRSFISVPLISNDLVIGGLTLRSKRRNAYTFDQLRTVERIGNQIAGAVANAGLHAELSSDSEQREALAEIGRIVSSSLDMDEVYGRFEHETKKLVPFDSLGIVTVDIERGMGWSAYRSGENWLALRAAEEYSLAGSPLEYAIETNSSVLIQGSEIEDMVARFPILSLATGVGYRSFITVPLTSNNVAIGGLSVRSLKWNAYANEHVEIVERVANQISGAIANAQLHYALARESSERDILAEIGRIMSSSLDIGNVFERFAEQVSRLIDFDRCSVVSIGPKKGTIATVYESGAALPGWELGVMHPLSGSAAESTFESGIGMVLTDDDYEESVLRHPQLADGRRKGFRSRASVPLISDDQAIGVLTLNSFESSAYSSINLALLDRIGMQIVGAVANAQLHAELEQQAHKREVLAEIGRIISASADPTEMYAKFVEQVLKLLDFDQLVLSQIDHETGVCRNFYLAGDQVPMRQDGSPFPFEGSFAQRVADARRGVWVTPESLPGLIAEIPGTRYSADFGLRSFIGAPMVVNDQVMGVLNVNSFNIDAYDDNDVAIVENIALQIAGAIANGDLYRQVQQEARERHALSEIGRIINSSAEPREVFAQFAEQVRELLDFDQIVLTHIDEESGTSTHSYLAGEQPTDRSEGDVYPLDGSFSQRVADDRKGIRTTSVILEELKDEIPGSLQAVAFGLQSFIGAPLVVSDRVIGVLHVNSFKDDAYDDHHVALVENIAMQIAGAIANGDLYHQLQDEVKERQALSEIGRIINSSAEPKEVFPRFAEAVRELLEYDHLVLTHIDVESEICTISYVTGGQAPVRAKRPEGTQFPLAGSFSQRVADARKGIRTTSSKLEELKDQMPGTQSAVAHGLKSFIGVPLVSNDRVMGVLHVNSFKADAYDDHDVAIAESIALQIAGAIANGDLYRKVQEEAKERRALSEIGRIINSSLSIGDVFTRFGDEVSKIIRFDRITVNLVDRDRQVFYVPYSMGVAVPNRLPLHAIPLEGSATEEVIKTGRPWSTNSTEDINLVQRFPGIAEGYKVGLRSFLSVPLMFNEVIIGVLHLRSKTPGEYGPRQLELAEHVAAQIAGAITNSELHAAQIATEKALQTAHDNLEIQVEQRTAELVSTNFRLREEIDERTRIESQLRSSNTELIEAHSMIRTANEFTDTILLNLPVGVAIMEGPEFRYTKINHTMAQINGVSVEGHIGKTVAEIVPDAAENILPRLKRVLDTGESAPSTEFPSAMSGDSGVTRWIMDSAFPLFGDDGEVISVGAMVLDITTRKQAEDVLRRSHDELDLEVSERTTELNDAVERLQSELIERKRLEEQLLQSQKMEAIGTLAGGVAHDFNNLLTAIVGNADLAQMTVDPDSRTVRYIDQIKRAGEAAATLTRQLLTFSRGQITNPEVFDLNDLILNLNEMFRRLINEDIELVVLLSPSDQIIEMDKGQIEQVMVNLAVNASDAMPQGGKLFIETRHEKIEEVVRNHGAEIPAGRYTVLSVRDTGIGMSEEVIEHIFEPFFTTKGMDEGTGLGLSTTFGIVKQSGGQIYVDSAPGVGAEFQIYLPSARDEPQIAKAVTGVSELASGTERILLVEDEELVRTAISTMLEQLGYQVTVAYNGEEALRMMLVSEVGEFQLVLTDIIMPLMNGNDLVAAMRNSNLDTKVLFMSGYADAATEAQIAVDETDFIPKPLTISKLASKLRQVLESSR
ncbi:MAG: GAF domain-containing protein [SAR202 cluster bacterium]|nr:GAF domain-containing protein [SAR202 cluster bacterium]